MSIMTARQLNLITTTWEMVKKVGLQEAGMIMFTKLFEINPILQDLFAFKGQKLNDNNETLRKHALVVMETVDSAIQLLTENKIDELVSTLQDLGVAHSMNNVKPMHFAPVGQALVYALSVAIADKFTAEVQESWILLYKVVQAKMEEGMAEELTA